MTSLLLAAVLANPTPLPPTYRVAGPWNVMMVVNHSTCQGTKVGDVRAEQWNINVTNGTLNVVVSGNGNSDSAYSGKINDDGTAVVLWSPRGTGVQLKGDGSHLSRSASRGRRDPVSWGLRDHLRRQGAARTIGNSRKHAAASASARGAVLQGDARTASGTGGLAPGQPNREQPALANQGPVDRTDPKSAEHACNAGQLQAERDLRAIGEFTPLPTLARSRGPPAAVA